MIVQRASGDFVTRNDVLFVLREIKNTVQLQTTAKYNEKMSSNPDILGKAIAKWWFSRNDGGLMDVQETGIVEVKGPLTGRTQSSVGAGLRIDESSSVAQQVNAPPPRHLLPLYPLALLLAIYW